MPSRALHLGHGPLRRPQPLTQGQGLGLGRPLCSRCRCPPPAGPVGSLQSPARVSRTPGGLGGPASGLPPRRRYGPRPRCGGAGAGACEGLSGLEEPWPLGGAGCPVRGPLRHLERWFCRPLALGSWLRRHPLSGFQGDVDTQVVRVPHWHSREAPRKGPSGRVTAGGGAPSSRRVAVASSSGVEGPA